MALARRIIPCLDVKNGETVKGVNFVDLRSAGDPVELGKAYSKAGADELVFLDITASFEGRKTVTEMVSRVAAEINIPFTVGGGINELADVERLLYAGADKVSVNSAAIRRPELIEEITTRFGSQVCVAAIDARYDADGWHCYLKGGRERTERGLFEWAHEVQERGAGEILFTSTDMLTRPLPNLPTTCQYPLLPAVELERKNTSAMHSQLDMLTQHWLPAYSILARYPLWI